MPKTERPSPRRRARRYELAAHRTGADRIRLAAAGAAVAAVAGAFAYTGGWLSPHRLTQARVVDRFERVNGLHAGFRRNHAKGVCFTGFFDSNGAGARLSKAAIFARGRTTVFGRFALAGGQPYAADGPKAVRSLAINFALSDGEIWRTGMNDIPVFPARDVQGFYEQLAASRPDPATGKPDPARMKAFLAAHPETVRAMALIKAQPVPSGFADAAYNSLDAFRFIDAAGASTPVRWSMTPEDAFQPGASTGAKPRDANYLFDALTDRLKTGPARWRMIVTIGRPGDPTDDPTTPWPADRTRVEVGVLTVDRLADETQGPCRDVTFDPLILPAGISPSDDPILSARSAAYSQSFARRAGEPAVSPALRLAGAQGAR